MTTHRVEGSNGACPYRGLDPYTEAYSKYFVGRERDQQTICANLFAMPMTVLYGLSGVGKSSVLLAGVVPYLKETPSQAVVIFRNWQTEDFIGLLKQQILDAVNQAAVSEIKVDLLLPLDAFLQECSQLLGGPIYLILDQFEEYFLYHLPSKSKDSFDSQFARIVNNRHVDAKVLLSMRGEELSKLDRFRGRIPNILGNMLRLDHLDRPSAERAIVEPLIEYNRSLPPEKHVVIEKSLVMALLQKSSASHESFNESGISVAEEPCSKGIETPVLQILLTRLWKEEMAAGSHTLRVATFNDALGGAESIISCYLDEKLTQLNEAEREVAANVFRYLVTPSRTKIAQDVISLAEWSEIEQPLVESVLTKLASPEMLVVRSLSALNQPKRYEIFHDVLAPAAREWRERFTRTRESKRADEQTRIARRLRWVTAALLIVCLAAIWAASYAISKKYQAEGSEQKWRDTTAALQHESAHRVQAEADKAYLEVKREIFKQEAEILRTDLEADELQTQHVHGALSKFGELLTRYQSAQQSLRQNPQPTDEEKELLKQYRLGEANTYVNIGNIHFEDGSNMSQSDDTSAKAMRTAIDNYNKALAIKRDVLGEDHQDVAPVCMDLAKSYHALEDDAKAVTHINKAIDIYQSKGGFSSNRPPLRDALETRNKIINKVH